MESPPPPPPPPPPPRPLVPPSVDEHLRRLRRSRTNRFLGGVAGGIADTYGWDPTLVRIAWIVSAFIGIGVPAYIVACIVIPLEPGADGEPVRERETSTVIGLALLALGGFWLAAKLLPDTPHLVDVIWPIALIGGGVAIIILRSSTNDDETEPPPFAPYDPSAPTMTIADIAETDAPVDADIGVDAPADAAPDNDEPTAPGAASTTSAWQQTRPWAPPRMPRPPRPPKPPRPRGFLGPIVFSLLCIAGGIVALLDTTDTVEINWEGALAIGLGVVGAALVVSAWYGRARGLIALGVVMTAVLTLVSFVNVPLEGGIGDRDYHPVNSAELEPVYRLAIGQMTLDLRDAPLEDGVTEIEASVAIGELRVQVPDDVTLEIDAHVQAGNIEIFGGDENGWDVDVNRRVGTGEQVLRLDLEVGTGHIWVGRFGADDIETIPGGN